MTTFVHKYKCNGCQLHFAVYSWNEQRGLPFCPECGTKTSFIYWLDESDHQIYQFIPGDSPIVYAGVKTAMDEGVFE